MTIITLLSSLPYLHEILTYKDGSMQEWVPNLGIQNTFLDSNGKMFNYSDYRYFLFTVFFNLFIFFGWVGWYCLKTNKPYRKAILLPLISVIYQIIIIFSSNRASILNDPYYKVIGILIIGIVLAYFYFPKQGISKKRKNSFLWISFFLISIIPYLHDILTFRNGELRSFIPDLGIADFLTTNNMVLGWANYRVFVFVLATHLFAQIGWAGWFFDARGKLFRPFLLVPIAFNLYEITIITINVQSSGFNKPDWKLYTVIIIAILIAINLYFNSDKALRLMHKKRAIE